MNDTIDQGNTFALLLSNHQHIHENIKFADQKAAFFCYSQWRFDGLCLLSHQIGCTAG